MELVRFAVMSLLVINLVDKVMARYLGRISNKTVLGHFIATAALIAVFFWIGFFHN